MSSEDRGPVAPRLADLRQLLHAGHLSEAAYIEALACLGVPPNRTTWAQFFRRLLLAGGLAFLLAGVVFFFAYNWDALSRFGKLGLTQALVLLAFGVAWWQGLKTRAGQAALGAACVLVGVVLAVFGQVYQTGADAYELFVGWLLLIVPWVLASRTVWIWLGFLALANISLFTYIAQVFPFDHPIHAALPALGFALNGCGLALWTWADHRGIAWVRQRLVPYLLHGTLLYALTAGAMGFIFTGWSLEPGWLISASLFVLWTGGCLWYFHTRARNRVVMAMCMFCIVVVVAAAILELSDFSTGGAFVTSVFFLLATYGAVQWLRELGTEEAQG